jgi:hypothetical protein
MLRILQSGNNVPYSFPVDPNAEFTGGNIGQLTTLGNNIVCGLSDGSAPIGIIDDVKTRAFFAPVVDEVVIAGPIAGVMSQGGYLVTPNDVKVELVNAYIQPGSFMSNPVDCELKATNGVLVMLTGTPLNFDLDGDGIPDSIRTVVSYSYQVPNVIGDDSTLGSGRITIHFGRIILETDQFEPNQSYPINCSLFSSPQGKFTSKQYNPNYPGVGLCLAPPTSVFGSIQIMWI